MLWILEDLWFTQLEHPEKVLVMVSLFKVKLRNSRNWKVDWVAFPVVDQDSKTYMLHRRVSEEMKLIKIQTMDNGEMQAEYGDVFSVDVCLEGKNKTEINDTVQSVKC